MSSVITLIVVTFVMRLIVLVCLFALACAAPPVLVQFYEESGCPDCQDFISGTLNTTLTNPALAAIINLQVFPWGNAYHQIAACPPAGPGYDRSGRFCWVTNCAPNVTNAPADCYLPTNVICQHGDVECAGNNVEMCVVNSYPTTEHQIAVASFMYCLEITYGLDLSKVSTCAARANLDYSRINACLTGPLLSELQVLFAQETAALGVAKAGVPWVVVNGQALDDVSTLVASVCAAYQGVKPSACP